MQHRTSTLSPGSPLEQHVYNAPACIRERCALCNARIRTGDTYYVDPDCMPVCAACAGRSD